MGNSSNDRTARLGGVASTSGLGWSAGIAITIASTATPRLDRRCRLIAISSSSQSQRQTRVHVHKSAMPRVDIGSWESADWCFRDCFRGFETGRLHTSCSRSLKRSASKVIRQSSREALRPLLTTIKANCPVRSGAMRQSIKIRSLKRSRKFVGATITVGDKEKAYVGKQFYASFIVFGWKTGSRRRTREAESRRIARDLRKQSRAAGGLGKRGDRMEKSTRVLLCCRRC